MDSQWANVGSAPYNYLDDNSQRTSQDDLCVNNSDEAADSRWANAGSECDDILFENSQRLSQEYMCDNSDAPTSERKSEEDEVAEEEQGEVFYLKKRIENLTKLLGHFGRRNQVFEGVMEQMPKGWDIFKEVQKNLPSDTHNYCTECDNERLRAIIKEQENVISILRGRSSSPVLGSNSRKRNCFHSCY
ncbi:DNA-directed RNA polymerase subunit beta' [Frankliniella fusca]|uniref:DNA-directed RNA polymerase subunit beta n=1 Tax=Frankliniella fusca TaxID=407009 RepID=A0AAE1H1B6_9NEOP|nr:DNA-directed RNA polymerase subunit beta' [Frankliniella fusca]